MTDINIKSTTIEESLDLAKGFVQKLIGPSVDEVGLLFADNLKLWRLKIKSETYPFSTHNLLLSFILQ